MSLRFKLSEEESAPNNYLAFRHKHTRLEYILQAFHYGMAIEIYIMNYEDYHIAGVLNSKEQPNLCSFLANYTGTKTAYNKLLECIDE